MSNPAMGPKRSQPPRTPLQGALEEDSSPWLLATTPMPNRPRSAIGVRSSSAHHRLVDDIDVPCSPDWLRRSSTPGLVKSPAAVAIASAVRSDAVAAVQQLRMRVQQSESETSSYRKDNASLQQQLRNQSHEMESLGVELARCRSAIRQLQASLEKSDSALHTARQVAIRAKQELSRRLEQAADLEETKASLFTQLQRSQERLKRSEEAQRQAVAAHVAQAASLSSPDCKRAKNELLRREKLLTEQEAAVRAREKRLAAAELRMGDVLSQLRRRKRVLDDQDQELRAKALSARFPQAAASPVASIVLPKVRSRQRTWQRNLARLAVTAAAHEVTVPPHLPEAAAAASCRELVVAGDRAWEEEAWLDKERAATGSVQAQLDEVTNELAATKRLAKTSRAEYTAALTAAEARERAAKEHEALLAEQAAVRRRHHAAEEAAWAERLSKAHAKSAEEAARAQHAEGLLAAVKVELGQTQEAVRDAERDASEARGRLQAKAEADLQLERRRVADLETALDGLRRASAIKDESEGALVGRASAAERELQAESRAKRRAEEEVARLEERLEQERGARELEVQAIRDEAAKMLRSADGELAAVRERAERDISEMRILVQAGEQERSELGAKLRKALTEIADKNVAARLAEAEAETVRRRQEQQERLAEETLAAARQGWAGTEETLRARLGDAAEQLVSAQRAKREALARCKEQEGRGDSLAAQLAEAAQQTRGLIAEVARARADAETVRLEASKGAKEVQKRHHAEALALREELESAEASAATSQRDTAVATQEALAARQRAETDQAALHDALQELSEARAAIRRESAEREALAIAQRKAEEETARFRSELAERQSQTDELREAVRSCEALAIERMAQVAALEEQLRVAHSKAIEAERRAAVVRDEAEAAARRHKAKARASARAIQAERARWEQQLRDAVERVRGAAGERVAELSEQLAGAMSEHGELIQELAQSRGYSMGVRSMMEPPPSPTTRLSMVSETVQVGDAGLSIAELGTEEVKEARSEPPGVPIPSLASTPPPPLGTVQEPDGTASPKAELVSSPRARRSSPSRRTKSFAGPTAFAAHEAAARALLGTTRASRHNNGPVVPSTPPGAVRATDVREPGLGSQPAPRLAPPGQGSPLRRRQRRRWGQQQLGGSGVSSMSMGLDSSSPVLLSRAGVGIVAPAPVRLRGPGQSGPFRARNGTQSRAGVAPPILPEAGSLLRADKPSSRPRAAESSSTRSGAQDRSGLDDTLMPKARAQTEASRRLVAAQSAWAALAEAEHLVAEAIDGVPRSRASSPISPLSDASPPVMPPMKMVQQDPWKAHTHATAIGETQRNPESEFDGKPLIVSTAAAPTPSSSACEARSRVSPPHRLAKQSLSASARVRVETEIASRMNQGRRRKARTAPRRSPPASTVRPPATSPPQRGGVAGLPPLDQSRRAFSPSTSAVDSARRLLARQSSEHMLKQWQQDHANWADAVTEAPTPTRETQMSLPSPWSAAPQAGNIKRAVTMATLRSRTLMLAGPTAPKPPPGRPPASPEPRIILAHALSFHQSPGPAAKGQPRSAMPLQSPHKRSPLTEIGAGHGDRRHLEAALDAADSFMSASGMGESSAQGSQHRHSFSTVLSEAQSWTSLGASIQAAEAAGRSADRALDTATRVADRVELRLSQLSG